MSVNRPQWLQEARDQWRHRGTERPPFADVPGPGQESAWDYPRPPVAVPDRRAVEITHEGTRVAWTDHAVRVLETSHPPAFYLPPGSLVPGRLVPVEGVSHCEWKGEAEYLAVTGTMVAVGWRYNDPYPEFAEYAGWVSFYPGRIRCAVNGQIVRPQAGGFYGGWITDDVVGPFKGEPGTADW